MLNSEAAALIDKIMIRWGRQIAYLCYGFFFISLLENVLVAFDILGADSISESMIGDMVLAVVVPFLILFISFGALYAFLSVAARVVHKPEFVLDWFTQLIFYLSWPVMVLHTVLPMTQAQADVPFNWGTALAVAAVWACYRTRRKYLWIRSGSAGR